MTLITHLEISSVLRVEWCKARARADRWKEECDLVQEEMRRVLQFFNWQSKHWQARADAVPAAAAADSDSAEGLVAYARRQADLRWSMRELCQRSWQDVPIYMNLGMETLESETSEDNEDEPSLAHMEDQKHAGDPDPSYSFPTESTEISDET